MLDINTHHVTLNSESNKLPPYRFNFSTCTVEANKKDDFESSKLPITIFKLLRGLHFL